MTDLITQAAAIRDAHHGTRITYSAQGLHPAPRCCAATAAATAAFAKAPARLECAVPHAPTEVLAIAEAGGARELPRGPLHPRRGARGALPAVAKELAGAPTATPRPSPTSPPWPQLVLDETGLLPHANAGALDHADLATLRPSAPARG